jgi:hypothetical protein
MTPEEREKQIGEFKEDLVERVQKAFEDKIGYDDIVGILEACKLLAFKVSQDLENEKRKPRDMIGYR